MLLELISKNNIWIGNNSFNSNIQVLDKDYNLIYDSIYSLQNLENILDFAFIQIKFLYI